MEANLTLAIQLWQRAYTRQMEGRFTEAIRLYRQSLAVHRTAEAHTFLGWTYSHLSRYEEAIEQCKLAIEVDPDFGNPYNDIGAYLIELERWEEAIPWLERAMSAPRYENRGFPHMNLGRVYEHLGKRLKALEAYRRAFEADPTYWTARLAHRLLIGKLN